MNLYITRRQIHKGKISSSSGSIDASKKCENLLTANGCWATPKREQQTGEFAVIDFGDSVHINTIELVAGDAGPAFLPLDFRFESSDDGREWQILHSERNFQTDEKETRFLIPLVKLRYLKLFVSKISSKGQIEIGQLRSGIAGVSDCTSSSTGDGALTNLFDDSLATFWESEKRQSSGKETIEIDLGQVYSLTRLTLSSHETRDGFPESFSIEASSDRKVWIPMVEEKRFRSEKGRVYAWSLDSVNARFVRAEVHTVKSSEGNYIARFSNFSIAASPVENTHTHVHSGNPPHASIFQGGLVRLAKDGEDAKGAAVQASDRRLRDGSTKFKGIVQLAENGESTDGFVLQSTDDRIKEATETRAGITRLAYDGERKAGSVVQGSDSRLKEASEHSFGIVRLSADGASSENGVVRGNDSRLKNATAETTGIMRFARDGEVEPNCAVQGNDKRIKDATISAKGIVELADDGEDKPGVVVQGNDRRIKDATISEKGIVELADDGEDRPGVVVQGNDKRIKDATISAKGIVELADDGEDRPGVVVQGNDKRIKDATISAKGIVRLANDGEDTAGVAVQSNDKRLKNATETAAGIMRFASNGEDAALAAVQGNDSRLKNSSTIMKGIVELAEDGEDSPGVVVQGNDRRLKDATTTAKGIVELAEDGEDRQGVVVQGNDKRLKGATTSSSGIIKLADDGEDSPGVAVQGNDKRLRKGNESVIGIVRFASDGESASLAAVQGNDRRLRDADTQHKGIVELAEDGENAPDVVVQGNDKRLREGNEETPGIVRFAKQGETRAATAVQANDDRLSNARTPLPHDHDYAPKNHDFSSHTGTIAVTETRGERLTGITPPPRHGTVIFAENKSRGKGAFGITGSVNSDGESSIESYGVLGHAPFIGVRGQSAGKETAPKGCGVLGISRFGAGGVFSSEHDFALVVKGNGSVDNYDPSAEITGSGMALNVSGDSIVNGRIRLHANTADSGTSPVNIVEYFQVDNEDHISEGDVLVVSQKGESLLSRSQRAYDRSCIGVVSGNPVLLFNNSGGTTNVYPVVLCGKALCKVDARENPIAPGDLIVCSDTPGCGMKAKIDSFEKIGTVIGKALESAEDGIGTIAIFVMGQ